MSSLLMSVDLEDVRDWVTDGAQYREALPVNTKRYLRHFEKWGVKATFFVVGSVARRYPKLIADIADAGHEIACHGNMHYQIDKLTRKEFREDLEQNRAALKECGVDTVQGFRAPTFSLTKETSWAHEVLAELGFTYSSSVLPAKNPLYGWPEFGKHTRRLNCGLWEIPVTLHDIPGFPVPVAGGVYFRVLPFFLTCWSIRQKIAKRLPVTTYFHPYDIDRDQERFMHPDLNDNKYLNMLMYIGRSKVLGRLTRLHELYPFSAYVDYIQQKRSVS